VVGFTKVLFSIGDGAFYGGSDKSYPEPRVRLKCITVYEDLLLPSSLNHLSLRACAMMSEHVKEGWS
jgi:hypothetical protein